MQKNTKENNFLLHNLHFPLLYFTRVLRPELLHQNLKHTVPLYHMNSIFQKKANDTINNQDTSAEKAKSLNVLAAKKKSHLVGSNSGVIV